jgi:hypothetical protein
VPAAHETTVLDDGVFDVTKNRILFVVFEQNTVWR